MPLYRYGYDKEGCLVDVFDLPSDFKNDSHNPFLCVSCGNPLSAKTLARKRVKHFAHKNAQPTCNFETYLHKLAKEAFRETFERCRGAGTPFLVQVPTGVHCCHPSAPLRKLCDGRGAHVWCNLSELYDTVRVESRDGQFIPDLLLSDSRDQTCRRRLYIEIFVTHAVTEEKAASGAAILEIAVDSEDFIAEYIRKARLPKATVDATNFKVKPVENQGIACSGCDLYKKDRIAGAAMLQTHGSAGVPRELPMSSLSARETAASRANIVPQHAALGDIIFLVPHMGSATLRFGPLEDPSVKNPEKFSYRHAEYAGNLRVKGPWRMPLTCLAQLQARRIRAPRHCFLCRHADMERRAHPMYGYGISLRCRKLRRDCRDNDAARCSHFSLPKNIPGDQPAFDLEME